MQKMSLKKFSLLGLLLMGGGAVIAAVLPAVKEEDKYGVQGSLTLSTENYPTAPPGLTCEIDTIELGGPHILTPCNITANSATTNIYGLPPSTDGSKNSTEWGLHDIDGLDSSFWPK